MSASMINIDFGTRRGWGEALAENAPFVPDLLCSECLVALNKLSYKTGVLKLGAFGHSTNCRLCALLLARFRGTAPASTVELEYSMIPRFGYFIRVHDAVFRPVGAKDFRRNVVRLGIQKAKLDRDVDGDHPPMVYFESDLGSSTGSERSIAQATKWFQTCCEQHEKCEREPSSQFVPSRLIGISGSEDGSTIRIRLRERSALPAEVCYATLSHCWGSAMPFKLEHEGLQACLNDIALNKISRVFQDAILVAWRLGIQYIWIDSLCIIQDSLKDWTSESAQMGLIYQHGVLNIAATGFPDGSNGLFVERDPRILTPISFSIGTGAPADGRFGEELEKPYPSLKPGNYYLASTSVWRNGVENSPLCGRGWVTQERALSVRTIHFGKEQLLWECMCENASEVLPRGLLRGTEIMDPKVLLFRGTNEREKRMEKLQSTREWLLERKKNEEVFKAGRLKFKTTMRSIMGSDYEDSDEDASDSGMNDKAFASRMMAVQNGNLALRKGTMGAENGAIAARKKTKPAPVSSEDSSDSDSMGWRYKPRSPLEPPRRLSMKDLELYPKDFEDCDLSVLDGLNIKGWKKFKAQLEASNIGQQARQSVEVRPSRSMSHEFGQWVSIVRLFSGCSLSFSSDKLVAISGMAQKLATSLKCEYLAGLWRKDLEHQLLWKVIQARPAPEQDHTRGPSWTWASVDGAIDIPEWGGYFSHGVAGEIEWMAKVDDARIELAKTGIYGQARSGILTLTGRLGVFTILQGEPKGEANERDGQGAETKMENKTPWISASWDTQELAEKFGTSGRSTYVQHHPTYSTENETSTCVHPLDVFFMPFRVMDADPDGHDYEQPMLTGLILLPIGAVKGTFRRVGQFELSGHWIRPHEEAFKYLSRSTALLDSRFYVAKRRRGQYTIRVV